jgi:glycosyltransferase involved in cell wall biosynthesis
MRILQIAPIWERVPPTGYGGTEAVAGVLTDALVRAGHDVVLRASGDSLTLAELRSVYHRSLRTAKDVRDGTPYDLVHAAQAIGHAADFDIVHNHAGEPVMALAGLAGVPMLSTMHCLITPDTKIVWDHYDGYYNTISHAQTGTVPSLRRPRHAGMVYNAIDVTSFPFTAEKQEHLLCINRVAPEKGTHLAIEVARRAGRKLLIAGKVDNVDREYFETLVEPLIDGHNVVFLGEADARLKRELYARAAAVLMPITWDEPFGLVMVEAMACGTPVIAMRRGAAPELVVNGETGFVVPDVEAMVQAIGRIAEINPLRCRRHVEANFDIPVMVNGYVRLYEEILGRGGDTAKPLQPIHAADRVTAEAAAA